MAAKASACAAHQPLAVHPLLVSSSHAFRRQRIPLTTHGPQCGQRGFDRRVGHFRPQDMADEIPQPPLLQGNRYCYPGRRLLGWPAP